MERRTFLGAAAAAAGLDVSRDPADPERFVDEHTATEDGTYQNVECGGVPGSLGHVEIAADMVDAPVEVSAWQEEGFNGVGLEWGSRGVSLATTLEPDDARELAERLRVAAAFADGDLDADEFGGEAGGA